MLKHHHATPTPPARVVILGATGFIARDLAQFLGSQQVPAELVGSARVDLLQPDAVEKLRARLRPDDALVVTSALTPEKGKDVPTFMKNLTMAASVCAAVEASPCAHLVYLSSDAVFEDPPTLLSEQAPRAGIGLYGKMHAAREEMLHFSAAVAKTPLCIIRPCAVYGAGDTHNSYGPNRFFRTALKDRKVQLFGNGEEQRDHIHVRDLTRLIGLCLARRTAGALNAATGRAVTFMEAAQQVARLCPQPVEIICQPRAANAVITHRHFDVSLLLREFPDFHCQALADGLAQVHRQLTSTPAT